MSRKSLNNAKSAAFDEFYTLEENIAEIVTKHKDKFKGKIVYACCDSKESMFVKYFTEHKDELGLKDFWFTGDDYKNHLDLIAKCDIICTNPPFSLISKEWFKAVKDKELCFIAPITIATYKAVFPSIKDKNLFCDLPVERFRCPKYLRKDSNDMVKMSNTFWWTSWDAPRRKLQLKETFDGIL